MATTREGVELIPPVRQRLWGPPAVVNFVCGGLGAGLYAAAVLAAGFGGGPAVTLAAWLGPALVLAGFVAVAAEAGRPLRGPRVLWGVGTSWMSRELWLGGAFAAGCAAEFVAPGVALRVAAFAAAVLLAAAQGLIVRHARGIAAWDVPAMPVVFLASAAVSGAGLLALVEVVAGRPVGGALLGATLVTLVLGAIAWLAYVTWSREAGFARATGALREGPTAVAIVGGGYLAPFLCAALALALPGVAVPAATLAGALMIAGQALAKTALILTAGQLRPVTLTTLRLERRSS